MDLNRPELTFESPKVVSVQPGNALLINETGMLEVGANINVTSAVALLQQGGATTLVVNRNAYSADNSFGLPYVYRDVRSLLHTLSLQNPGVIKNLRVVFMDLNPEGGFVCTLNEDHITIRTKCEEQYIDYDLLVPQLLDGKTLPGVKAKEINFA